MDESPKPVRAITAKAIICGLIGVLLISSFASFSNNRLKQVLIIGNHFPIAGYAFFFLITLFWNLFWTYSQEKKWTGYILLGAVMLVPLCMGVWQAVTIVFETWGWIDTAADTFWRVFGIWDWAAFFLVLALWGAAFSPFITGRGLLFAVYGMLPAAGIGVFTGFRLGLWNTPFYSGGLGITALFVLFWFSSCLGRKAVFSRRELAIVLSMVLVACWVPTMGLQSYLSRMLILPWHYNQSTPTWEKYEVLDYLPKKLFPLDADKTHEDYNRVYDGFVKGTARGNEMIPVSELPMGAWKKPLFWWSPVLIVFSLCIIGLALLVHRQWVSYEQLRYPLAQAATVLFKRTGDNRIADVFSNRFFWWGCGSVFGLYMITYCSRWWPEYFPSIPLSWRTTGIWSLFPILNQAGGFWLWGGSLFFTVAGITYFISSEIGLTLGVSQFLLAFCGVQFYLATGKPLASQDVEILRGGAYIGYALILLYTGRTYFKAVFLKAFGFGKPLEFERESVFAARLFVLTFFCLILLFVLIGVDWLIAFIFTTFLMLLMLVFTRIICETGIPFMQSFWFPKLIVQGLGASAVGGGPMIMIFFLGAVLQQDIRECLMPYVSTSLKVADDMGVKRKPLVWIMMGSICVALVAGFIVTLLTFYSFGSLQDSYAAKYVPQQTFSQTISDFTTLSETGQLSEANSTTGLGKLLRISIDVHVWGYVLTGIAVVIALSLLRFRMTKWPIHPVLLLVWGTYPMGILYWSFLIGWAVKELIVRFGGGEVYEKLKPLFIGIIMGELLAGGVSILIGFLYYFLTGGLIPVSLKILPV